MRWGQGSCNSTAPPHQSCRNTRSTSDVHGAHHLLVHPGDARECQYLIELPAVSVLARPKGQFPGRAMCSSSLPFCFSL